MAASWSPRRCAPTSTKRSSGRESSPGRLSRHGPESDYGQVAGQAEAGDRIGGIELAVAVRIQEPLTRRGPEDADAPDAASVPIAHHRKIAGKAERGDFVGRVELAVAVAVNNPRADAGSGTAEDAGAIDRPAAPGPHRRLIAGKPVRYDQVRRIRGRPSVTRVQIPGAGTRAGSGAAHHPDLGHAGAIPIADYGEIAGQAERECHIATVDAIELAVVVVIEVPGAEALARRRASEDADAS